MVRYCRLLHDSKTFSCKIGYPHVFSCSGVKVTEGFAVINNLAATDKVTFNFSICNSNDHEKSVLCKGLGFVIPQKTIQYSEFLLPFGIFTNLEVSNVNPF